MRGTDTQQSSMFSYLSPEERVPCLQLEEFFDHSRPTLRPRSSVAIDGTAFWKAGGSLRPDCRALGEWPRRRVGTRSPCLLRSPLPQKTTRYRKISPAQVGSRGRVCHSVTRDFTEALDPNIHSDKPGSREQSESRRCSQQIELDPSSSDSRFAKMPFSQTIEI